MSNMLILLIRGKQSRVCKLLNTNLSHQLSLFGMISLISCVDSREMLSLVKRTSLRLRPLI